jgi:hypothetical protein
LLAESYPAPGLGIHHPISFARRPQTPADTFGAGVSRKLPTIPGCPQQQAPPSNTNSLPMALPSLNWVRRLVAAWICDGTIFVL